MTIGGFEGVIGSDFLQLAMNTKTAIGRQKYLKIFSIADLDGELSGMF